MCALSSKSVLCILCASFNILGGFMKWALRNKTAEKRFKMAIFKWLVLSYMHTTIYISFFYSNNIIKFYVVRKYKKKFESTNMGLAHFKILIFFRLFKYGGRVGNRILSSTSSCKFFYAFGPK